MPRDLVANPAGPGVIETGFRELDFQHVDAALRAWPNVPPPAEGVSTPVRRLINAVRSASDDPRSVGPADLAVLLRHVLRSEAEMSGTDKGLRVPTESPWPTRIDWDAFGMTATAGTDEQIVFAHPWLPDWLGAHGTDPAASAFRGFYREPLGDVPQPSADPFLTSITGLVRYQSTGQREAIRAVVATPSTATVIGNLPTGTGKSLVAYVPALISDAPGTTLVMVPTTSLALDQERAFRELIRWRSDRDRFPHELAYHGGLPDATRSEIKRRVADGTQQIVFSSPESLFYSLSSAVYAAAERGLIRAFVIDEAHIVSQWGAGFRPAFQALTGMRADLLRVAAGADAGFRTILLSATLTEESLLTLQGLFGRPGPTELISSVALRHEPSYWLASCGNDAARDQRIVECIRHLPRPLVLYTTRVADARAWHERLTGSGHRRLMLVAGETDAAGRREAINRLRDGSLDLVVGTSAFGLGVDQPDLRAVVHACVPETVDRYYQEVGRGGRDGRPSVSVLIEAPRDRGVADGLSRRRLISLERGFERWQAMHQSAEDQGEARLRVPLYASPPDIEGDSDQNRAWNVRTLLLMDRGGLVSLEATPPPRRAPEETDEDWEERAAEAFEEYASHAVVRLRVGALADGTVWEHAVGEARREAVDADRLARRRMNRAVEPGASSCKIFAESYRIERPLPGIPERQIPVPVVASCGGCPGCRAAGLKPRRYPPPVPLPVSSTSHAWSASLQPWFAGRSALAAIYPPENGWKSEIVRALERLARNGMWCLMASAPILESHAVRELHRIAPGRAVFHLQRWDQLHGPLLPTALVYSPGVRVSADVLDEGGPRRVVFVPGDAVDPRHGTALIGEYHSAVTTVQDLLERL